MLLATAVLIGCQTTIAQRPFGARTLTGAEMDAVTAGSALAANHSAAYALGPEAQTTVLGSASAYSGNNPIAASLLLNYANSQAAASASGGNLAQTGLSSQVSVDGANGGVSVEASATGTGASQAQVTAQFYGISTNRSDAAFGSVVAVACCGSGSEVQVNLDSTAGGPYSRELRGTPVSATPGQVQSRIDVAVVSSAMPLLDPAQVLVAGSPARVSPKY
jgi:hypothetical protein